MYIKISKNDFNNITLDVHSYSENEFMEVQGILTDFEIRFRSFDIDSDDKNRRGRRFEISESSEKNFEDKLNIRFIDGRVHFNMNGKPFMCKEISRGSGKGCETILANDKKAARIICSSYIAPKNGWFSSFPEEGKCKKKGFWK